MKTIDNFTAQQNELLNLLWDSLKRQPGRPDVRVTSWGTKTKRGLLACVERIYTPDNEVQS